MKKTLLVCFLFLLTNGLLLAQNQTEWHFISQYQFEAEGNGNGAIYPVNENLIFVVANGGRFYKSIDGGTNWTEYDTNISESFFDLKFLDETKGFAVGSNGTLMKTTNAGETWTAVELNSSDNLLAITNSSSQDIFVVGENGFFARSTNGGESWSENASLSEEVLTSVKFKNETTGFISGTNGTFLKTDDAGTSWQPIDVGVSEDLFSLNVIEDSIYMLAGSSGNLDDEEYFPSFSANKLVKSVEGGQNWENSVLDVGLIVSDLYFTANGNGFLSSGDLALCDCCFNGIYKTTDNGESWSEYVYRENSGNDFQYCGFDPAFTDIHFVDNDIGYVLLGEHIFTNADVGYFSTEDFKKKASISIYPNPVSRDFFNLDIKQTAPSQLDVQIFDINGRLIKEFGQLQKKNKVDVSKLSKGIYFVSIKKAGKVVNTKKLIRN